MSSQHEWTKQKLTILYALRQGWPWLLASLLVLAWLSLSFAYVQNMNERGDKSRWAEKAASIAFRLGCENTDTIIDVWGPCWDDVAERAMETWNDAGSQFRYTTVPGPSTARLSCMRADRTRVVVWGSTLCGQAFGADTLAITRIWEWEDGRIDDADIVFNTRYEWAAYPGPWLFGQPDLYRVAIHEFGHMLGLAHPDDHGQYVTAIMNAYADDTETLQPDDIAGVRAIYGVDSDADPIDPPSTVAGVLENPGHRRARKSYRSGIGVMSGWVCDAQTVEVIINTTPYRMAYGTERPDTLEVCGDTDNGFVSLFNFNRLSEGRHLAWLRVDGKIHDGPLYFTVTTFGEEFLEDASGQYEIAFPTPGDTTVLIWDQNSQNFQVKEVR